MPPPTLGALLDRAAVSDASAFACFFDRTVARALLLTRLTCEDDDVERVVLDSYLQAWIDSPTFRLTGFSAQAWLMLIVAGHVEAVRAQRTAGPPVDDRFGWGTMGRRVVPSSGRYRPWRSAHR